MAIVTTRTFLVSIERKVRLKCLRALYFRVFSAFATNLLNIYGHFADTRCHEVKKG